MRKGKGRMAIEFKNIMIMLSLMAIIFLRSHLVLTN